MNFNTAHFYESFIYGIRYFPNTLRLVFIPLAIGLTLGTVTALARFLHIKTKAADVDNIWVGIFALSLTAVCSISEGIRGALLSIDRGQDEAGYSVGLTKVQTIRRIIIPQMIPAAIPTLINQVVGLIKASSVVKAIGIIEIVAGATIPSSRTYSFFEGYVAAAVIYWAFTIVIEYLAKVLRGHMSKFRRNPYD